jgi:hypothetical protein
LQGFETAAGVGMTAKVDFTRQAFFRDPAAGTARLRAMGPVVADPVSHRQQKGREFDAEPIRVMGIAFECARSVLHVFPSDEALSEAVAAKIIERARTGERDAEKLCDFAIAALEDTTSA